MRFQIATLLLLLLILLTKMATAQSDTLFWFAAPKVVKHGPDEAKTLLFRMAAADQDAVVQFSQPANPAFPVTTILVPANQSRTFNVTPWLEMIENLPTDSLSNQGIRIHATAAISVYYEATDIDDYAFNPEIYVLKGQAALGDLFFLPFQAHWTGASIPPAFTLVATEDQTTVVITPTKDLLNHPANVPYWIELQKGQTYSVRAENTVGAYFLSGTKVESNKPIAITIVDDSVREYGVSTCADQVGDQITAVTSLGTEYIIVQGLLSTQIERVFVIASEDNTEVVIHNSVVATLQAGEWYQYTSSVGELYFSVSASAPAYVYHVTGIGCEVGGAQLPGLDCRGSRRVQFTRANGEALYLFLLAEGETRNFFSINGIPVNEDQLFGVGGPSGDWYGGWIEMDTSWVAPGAICTVTNSEGLFQLGIIHGGSGSGTRYGYFSDYQKLDAQLPDRIDTCGVSAITLSVPDLAETDYLWNTGAQTVNTQADISGWYWVELSRDNCVDRDSVWVQFDAIASDEYLVLCPGDSLNWRGLTIPAGGQYEVQTPGSDEACDTTFYLHVFQLPVLQGDTLYQNICQGQEISFGGNSIGQSGVYLHASNATDSCGYAQTLVLEVDPPYLVSRNYTLCEGESLSIGAMVYTQPGTYLDTLRDDNACFFVEEINLTTPPSLEVNATIFPAITAPNGVILLDTLLGLGHTFRWSNGAQGPNIGQLAGGNYQLSVTDEFGCQFIFDFTVEESNGFYLPNAFSPNGDGVNDDFRFFTALADYQVEAFQVYDRWGGMLYSSTEQAPRWDGRKGGRDCPVGVYSYLLKVNIGLGRDLLWKGAVMLVR